jgi:glycosyltransferase involved in cell wall biosynthesis
MTTPAVSYAGLVPALDAADTIGDVVRGALRRLDCVVVVDDGSRDATATEARAAGAEVLSHAENFGKGAALVSGLRYLGDRGFRYAVALDADGQHLPDEIPKLVEESEVHPEAIICGARQIETDVASINRFGNELANLWVWIATGRDLGDTQCGFRVYPIAATLGLGSTGQRFDFETEVLIRAVRAGIDVRSLPIRVYYPPPDVRISHYDKFWDTVRIIEAVVGLILRVR